MQPVVRPFKSSEARAIVPVHAAAFPDYVNTRLGSRYLERFLAWFAEHPRRAIALAAKLEDRFVGYVVGVDMADDHLLVRDLRGSAVRGLVTHPWMLVSKSVRQKIFSRMRVILGQRDHSADGAPPLPEPVMGLFGIAVDPTAHGRRIGSQLMEAFEAECQARSVGSMLLSVYRGNEAAERLYRRHGWAIPPGDPFAGRAHYYCKSLTPASEAR